MKFFLICEPSKIGLLVKCPGFNLSYFTSSAVFFAHYLVRLEELRKQELHFLRF